MKIAMPYQDGVLLEHFGRAKEFIIYNVSDLDPVTSEVIAPEDLSHAAVARALKEHGVDVVLCGSIGEHARQAVEGEHMLVFSGITGAADDVLERFLQGNLEAVDGDFAAGGGCGGCGGGCASEPYRMMTSRTDGRRLLRLRRRSRARALRRNAHLYRHCDAHEREFPDRGARRSGPHPHRLLGGVVPTLPDARARL